MPGGILLWLPIDVSPCRNGTAVAIIAAFQPDLEAFGHADLSAAWLVSCRDELQVP